VVGSFPGPCVSGSYVHWTALSFMDGGIRLVMIKLYIMSQNMYIKAAALWAELRVELLSALEYYAEDKNNSAHIWRLYWASHQVVPFPTMQQYAFNHNMPKDL
jgi:hypothetical protein